MGFPLQPLHAQPFWWVILLLCFFFLHQLCPVFAFPPHREEKKGTVENGDLEKEKVSVVGPRHGGLHVQLPPGLWVGGGTQEGTPNRWPKEVGAAH